MAFPRFRPLTFALIAAAAAVLYFAHSVWLSAFGNFLVRAEEPQKADIAVVLAGDSSGRRILAAASLVKQGFVPNVLVSGPGGYYGRHESDLAIAFAASKGYPADWFIPLPMRARSTREEAVHVLAELERRGVRGFLLVTSNYHTRRAAAIYRSLAPGYEFRVVAAPDIFFRPDGWWRTREGQKQFLLEWQKTIAGWVGL